MQKISTYLYPNRINVVADVALFPVRWSIVYQNRIKIYQGVDNVLTIDVKNSDQKRIDISNMDLRMIVMDTKGLLVADVEVTPGQTTGLALATIPESSLVNIDPQFLTFSIYKVNQDQSKTVLYADTQFGAKGNMELVGNIMNVAAPMRYITRFAPITDPAVLGLPPYTIRYYSDAVEIKQENFLQAAEDDQLNFEFLFSGLEGEVQIQFTKDPVISTGDIWNTVDTFTVTTSTTSVSKSFNTLNGYNRELTWARVIYTPVKNNTGKIDKVIVTV